MQRTDLRNFAHGRHALLHHRPDQVRLLALRPRRAPRAKHRQVGSEASHLSLPPLLKARKRLALRRPGPTQTGTLRNRTVSRRLSFGCAASIEGMSASGKQVSSCERPQLGLSSWSGEAAAHDQNTPFQFALGMSANADSCRLGDATTAGRIAPICRQLWLMQRSWKTCEESPAPKPADVRRRPRLSVSLGQHLRIGKREKRQHRAPVSLQRLLGYAIPAGIAPIKPEAGCDVLASGALDGSEEY